jgi:hypothetical protein
MATGEERTMPSEENEERAERDVDEKLTPPLSEEMDEETRRKIEEELHKNEEETDDGKTDETEKF